MQSVLREKLISLSMQLADVSRVYLNESSRFVDAYLVWLIAAEKELSGLRAPLCVVLQAEKSVLLAVQDGYLPDNIQAGRSSRKNQRAAAAQSIEKISNQMYQKIEAIDETLEELREKLCLAISVLQTKIPDLFYELKVDQKSVNYCWKLLQQTPETLHIFNYLCAKLTSADRSYLLTDIIQKILDNQIK